MTLEETREALLQAALPHVLFDGWTEATLRAAARDVDLTPEAAINAFPEGPRDLVEAFSHWADEEMLRGLAALDLEERSEEHTSELQSREKIVCRLLLEKKK